MVDKKKSLKKQNIYQLLLALLILFLLNLIGYSVFTRFDLTSEKRYSLSDATKKGLKELKDIVYFNVYLEGEFPAGFKRLRNETREMLNQFRAYSDNIHYEFINPSEGNDKKKTKELYQQLVEKGLEPTNLQVKAAEGTKQQIIFPGAIVSYRGKELPLQLLMSQMGTPPEAILNNSIQSLEYNISNVIRKLTVVVKPKLAFLEGHGELNNYDLADVSSTLADYYEVKRVRINHQLNALNGLKVLVIAKPDSVFDEKDKFIIDQYVMKGGKVLWLIDPINASMDSLQKSAETTGVTNQINLDDQLFKYGVRLNPNLIMDLNALAIPIVTGKMGNQPQQNFIPWPFFPLLSPTIKHPIINNLNSVKTEFISTMDTIGQKNIKKTILLTSSKYSRIANTPIAINLNMLRKDPDERMYTKSYLPVAVLLEGKFESVFKNRIPPEIYEDKSIGFKEVCAKDNKMIVISDGDIIRNQLQMSNGNLYPLPLGFDRYTKQQFGNKDFILNCIDYLSDESGLISV
ncbi:MAG: gliding motility-associated ABC transporter substrate-binding protein GldG, partial [Bacteroidetes bacterium]|nr:gliding motility-associated ABC transporter substrate-binding protein GldG [Bacteroidota bacterium]